MPKVSQSRSTLIPELDPHVAPDATIRVSGQRTLPLTRRVQRVIDHPSFQRLRKVRQLGPTHWVYPGATHTRFEHALGVYGTTREFLLSLLKTPAFARSVSESQLLGALAAGLLHDIGHYPFAHSLEALHHKGKDTPRHEQLGADILMGKFEELHPGVKPLAEILRWEWRTSPELVCRLMTLKREELENPVEQILQSIISGTIDADKMDYMERDGTHLGVPYGSHYDRGRLLGNLTLNEKEDHIAIHAKGKLSAESFVFCRYTLFSEVYWHHTVRAASAMVEASLGDIMPSWDPDELSLELLRMSDDELLESLKIKADRGSRGARLLSGMTGNNRHLYKRIMTISPAYEEKEKKDAYNRLLHLSGLESQEMVQRLSERVEKLVGHPVAPGTLLIDIPPRDKDRVDPFPVRFAGARGKTEYSLGELSQIVAGVGKDMLRVVKKIRIFCEPSIVAELRGRQVEMEEALLDEVLKP